MTDDDRYYRNEIALGGLDAWITREPEEQPCGHDNASWNEAETLLSCPDCGDVCTKEEFEESSNG